MLEGLRCLQCGEVGGLTLRFADDTFCCSECDNEISVDNARIVIDDARIFIDDWRLVLRWTANAPNLAETLIPEGGADAMKQPKKSIKLHAVKATGPARMLQLGKRPVQLWLTPQQYETIRRVADEEMRPMTTMILSCVMASIKQREKEGA